MTQSPPARVQEFAKVIEGRIIDDDPRFEVYIKGTVLGFPATFQGIRANWPLIARFSRNPVMIRRLISFVPSKMRLMRASR